MPKSTPDRQSIVPAEELHPPVPAPWDDIDDELRCSTREASGGYGGLLPSAATLAALRGRRGRKWTARGPHGA